MAFVRWESEYREGYCGILAPENVEDDWELSRGVSRAEGWPDDVRCTMDPEFPKDLQLADNLYGTHLAIISKRLRAEIESQQDSGIEYLPLEILDHKGRTASRDHYILNPLNVVDCIDIAASGVDWNPLNEEVILGCEGLVLKPDVVPAEIHLFRPQSWPRILLARAELADSLRAEGFTGLDFRPAEGYTGVG